MVAVGVFRESPLILAVGGVALWGPYVVRGVRATFRWCAKQCRAILDREIRSVAEERGFEILDPVTPEGEDES